MYIQGLSTSMPKDVQEQLVRSIPGLENAVITKYAYAIEYDAIDPQQLKHNLEAKHIDGLFFAGQVNGTSGYEEAACQGLIAGINASLKLQNKEPDRKSTRLNSSHVRISYAVFCLKKKKKKKNK